MRPLKLVELFSYAFVLFLASCDSGPTRTDIVSALKEEALRPFEALVRAFPQGASQATELREAEDRFISEKIEIGTITKQNDGSYIAIVSIDGIPKELRMTMISNHWKLLP